MKKLRLGLVGTGVAAERLYLPALATLGHRIELVACANRTRKKAERFARLAGVGTVVDDADALFALPEVEAVLVSLPIDLQPAVVLAALRAGKGVLSEKPVGPSVAAARRLIKKAERFEPPWLVGENFAFMSHALALEALVKKGKLGRIRLIEAAQLALMGPKNPYFHTAWRTQPKFVGGFVVDSGVHVAHVLRRCFGMPEVGTPLTASFDPRLPPLDTVVATLRFDSGALGTWTSCFSTHAVSPLLRVHGSRGTAELFWGHLSARIAGRETRHEAKTNSFAAEFEHFANVVQRGAVPRVRPEDALEDLILLESLVRPRPGTKKSRQDLTSRARRG